jgi:hypothetical protein
MKKLTEFRRRSLSATPPKIRIILKRDAPSMRGSLLASGKVYHVDEAYAKKLITEGKAVPYNKETAKRVVNVDGVEMTWGDYLRRMHEKT